ncbi:hypothetical protein DV736_g866, partial [Chaetothyriales sp. CBS 134916]
MSGPYDSYGGNYNQGSQYPQQGYNQGGYPPQQPPQQGYGGQQDYNQYPSQNYGPPRRADSFGPPQQGGFQHGQAGGQYGAYDASNPQGHSGYYGQQHQGAGQDAYQQNQQYQQSGQQYGGHDQQQYPQTSPQSSDPNAPNYDPNAPPMTESDRGLLGAIGGGVAGHFAGKKAGHGFLGTIGGAIMGSLAEDFVKDKKKHHNNQQGYGNSSWGGSNY